MSKIPPQFSLRTEDYPPEERSWLPRLFLPLNQFLTSVTNTINGRIDFGANIPAVTTTLSFVYDGSSQKIAWPLSLAPVILWVGQASEGGIAIYLNPVWTYDFSTSLVTVSFLKANGSALTSKNSYKIVIRIVP